MMKSYLTLLAGILLMLPTLSHAASGSAATPGASSATGQAKTAAKATSTSPATQPTVQQEVQPSDAPFVTKLANGLTVLVKEDSRFPLVSLRLYVHAGSAYERPEEAGISHMLEHMVFKGTKKRPRPGQVAEDVEKIGGYLNAATSFDYTVYLTDMTKEHWKEGLDVLNDMAFAPLLDEKELTSEKDVVVAELKRGEDNPGQRLFKRSQKAVCAGTTYENPIIGFEQTVRAITSNAMRAYIARLYQPQSMLLVVCGDVRAQEVTAEATRLFGGLVNTAPVTPPSGVEKLLESKGFTASVETGPWNKVHLSLAMPAPAQSDVTSAQLDVLAQILGGDATSRFYRTYKYEKRLVDSISVSCYGFERLGMLNIHATLDADKLVPFWESFTQDLAALKNTTFSKEELSRAKLNIEDDLFRSKETLAGYASKLGYFAFFDDGERGESNYLKTVNATDQATLVELINRYFNPDVYALSALLPADAKAENLLPKTSAPADWKSWFSAAMEKNNRAKPANKKREVTTPDAGAPSAPEAPLAGTLVNGAEIIDLGNGRTLVLTPDTTLPYAAANLVFTGGDSLLGESDQGLAAFTASLIGKGTKDLSATALEDFLSDRAASFGAATGKQTFTLSINGPSRFTADLLGLMNGAITSPAFKDEEAERVRENQISAITMREDLPTGLAFRRMFPFLFGSHPYGYMTQGEKDSVAKMTAKDAAGFWKEQRRQPWVLSVCGTFERDAVIEAAKKMPVPDQTAAMPETPAWGNKKELTLSLPGRNQAHLFLVFPSVEVGHADEAGMELMQNILAGQSGLLFRDLRDKQGLGYTVTAFPWKAEKAGALIFYIGTEPDKVAQAEAGFHSVIASLKETPLPEAELARGKNQIKGDYYRDRQSLASRSGEAALLTALGHPLDSAQQLVKATQSITPEHIQKLAQRYLKVEEAYSIKVLP